MRDNSPVICIMCHLYYCYVHSLGHVCMLNLLTIVNNIVYVGRCYLYGAYQLLLMVIMRECYLTLMEFVILLHHEEDTTQQDCFQYPRHVHLDIHIFHLITWNITFQIDNNKCMYILSNCKAYRLLPFIVYVSCTAQNEIPCVLQSIELTASTQIELSL